MRWVVAGSVVALLGCYRNPAPEPVAPTPTATRPAGHTANPDPLAFLPIDAELVLVLETQQIRGSTIWKQLEPFLRARGGALLADISAKCKFDPIVSLRRVSLGLHDLDKMTTGTLVVRGYKRDVIMECVNRLQELDSHPIKVEHGVIIVNSGESRAALAFADDTTLVSMFGPEATPAAVTAAIDGGAPLRMVPRFVDLISKIEVGAMWFVVEGTAKPLVGANALGARPAAMMGSLDLSDGFAAQLRIRFEQPDQATAATTILQNQITSLQSFVDSVDVAADDVDSVIRLKMTVPQVQSLFRLFGVP